MKLVISLYCGADGLGHGIETALGKDNVKFICVDGDPKDENTMEYSKTCLETVKLNHKNVETIHSPVGEIIESLPTKGVFAVVGGPPCQDFSPANTNRGYDLCEVGNFEKAVDHCNPENYFMENVPDINKVYKKQSYLVNAADYGTPQTRKRRIFTNLQRPKPTHAENPQTNLLGDTLKKWVSVREALNLETGVLQDRKTTFGDGFRNYNSEKPSFTLLSDSRVWYVSRIGFDSQNGKELTRDIDKPSHTLLASRDMLLTDYPIYSRKYIENNNPEIYKKHPLQKLDRPASTILSKDRGFQGEGMITDEKYARKLTNEECAVLQGFPRTYKFYGNKTSVRRQVGNAVPPQISEAFFRNVS